MVPRKLVRKTNISCSLSLSLSLSLSGSLPPWREEVKHHSLLFDSTIACNCVVILSCSLDILRDFQWIHFDDGLCLLGSMALSSRMMLISWPGDRLPWRCVSWWAMDSHGFITSDQSKDRKQWDFFDMTKGLWVREVVFLGGGLGSKIADSWTKKWQWCKKFLPWTQQQLNTQQPASHANEQTTCLTQILSNLIDCPGQPLRRILRCSTGLLIIGVAFDHLPGGGFLSTLTPLENSWITMVLAGWLQAGNSQAFLRHWSWDPCLHPHHRPQVIAYETCIHTWHWFNSLQMGV